MDQGQQYFRSAETAGPLVGPLEQYYGILAIARAIVLYRDPKATEGTLEKKHGLSARLPQGGQTEDINLVLDSGTFDQFLDATGNVEQVSVDLPHPGTTTAQQVLIRSLPDARQSGAGASEIDLIRDPRQRGAETLSFDAKIELNARKTGGHHATSNGFAAHCKTPTTNVVLLDCCRFSGH